MNRAHKRRMLNTLARWVGSASKVSHHHYHQNQCVDLVEQRIRVLVMELVEKFHLQLIAIVQMVGLEMIVAK